MAEQTDEHRNTKRLDAVDKAADAQSDKDGRVVIEPTVQEDATAWFMSTDEEEVGWAMLPVNVAPAGVTEKVIDFHIQVVGREKIKQLRKEAERVLPSGIVEVDEMEANLKIAVEGLLKPNIKNDASLRVVRGQEFMDPADALQARFAHKPGIIDQIAGKVVQISGYNDNDIKEIKAAGNS